MSGHPRVAFVFTWGRRSRLARGAFASELLYGYLQLQRRGWNVDLIEEDDFGSPSSFKRWRRLLPHPFHMDLVRLGGFATPRALRHLNAYDVVLATNQQIGLELSVLSQAGLLRPPIVMLVMGLLPPRSSRNDGSHFLRALLRRRTSLAVISRGETRHLEARFGREVALRYVPFGIDFGFWSGGLRAPAGYVLSVGNDSNRDFDLLARVWRPEWPPLRIITTRRIPPSRGRVEIVRGDYREAFLTDAQMRDQIDGALFSVIPVRETYQPSGQSAALQSMAAGVPVIISDTRGLWDRDVMVDGEACLLAAAGSPAALTDAVERMLASADLREHVGAAGRAVVERHFTVDVMADGLCQLLDDVHERSWQQGEWRA